MGPHTTADDPTRYRGETEVERMKPFDPLLRVRRYLEDRGLWSAEDEQALEAEVQAEVERAVQDTYAIPPADPADIFDHTYAELPPYLTRQKRAYLDYLSAKGA
jgi:pyruvate dehydrogenase E1 component alpha subunit